MASQSTIDRINNAIIALGHQKDLLKLGNADRPDSRDVLDVGARMQIVGQAIGSICLEYDVEDGDFHRAADRADERLSAPRGLRCLVDEDYAR